MGGLRQNSEFARSAPGLPSGLKMEAISHATDGVTGAFAPVTPGAKSNLGGRTGV
jgi:hypothetical protein